MMREVQEYIEYLQEHLDVVQIQAINGQYHIWLTGFKNRQVADELEPIHLVYKLATYTDEAYGIIYVYDDEAD
ncbi:Imm7 family immunity protein [Paenibacillus sp. WLX2291]|uniref:Imm7 family immunity protein n=1 Tax=Paenibacillus sp. WLX2291 TaxID=3296934 RepID=UPI0039843B54